MRVILKNGLLEVSPETDDERQLVQSWASTMDGHAFVMTRQEEQILRMADLGLRSVACREPVNVTFTCSDPQIRLISNLAHTPFELDSVSYASVEGFWQGLKFPAQWRRREIASLHGKEAKRAGRGAEESNTIVYFDQAIRVGTFAHWQLMSRACAAKFTQHEEAKNALLSTVGRPLTHITRRDSRTIPGVIMAEIWMRVRRRLVEMAPADFIG
jgi:predicted NAD-dependent protein-ADP-ribosyltransferase YbiA (DUF1768 family)